MAFSDFFTKPASEAGVKIPLPLPDGSESSEWVLVAGMESDRYRQANAIAEREALSIPSDVDHADRVEAMYVTSTRLIASLIIEWSFKKELSLSSATELLDNAPYIRDLINRSAADRAAFVKKKP